ncbi:hypothetical protein AB0K40_17925 [Nonomuraea bangladeshensis]|uniref:Uncharacterized protein n=1 Tax=Nonomuraea bangladeshensis TaxID=404385 RepID=A0ABV3H4D6_9ACTN
MADDYRQRCTDAALSFILGDNALTSTMQSIWVSSLVDAVLAVRDTELEQAREDRDQAIAHDRQPYPTQWAYDQACAALEQHRQRADAAEAEVARLRALLDGQEVTDDEEDEPGCETVTAHLGEMLPTRCANCSSDQLLSATVHGLTASGSRIMGGIAVCHGCGWSPYGDAVLVARADLDLVMNRAGDPTTVAEYPAACQRVRDALEGGRRG